MVLNHYNILAGEIVEINCENKLTYEFFVDFKDLKLCTHGHLITKKNHPH